MRVAVQSAGWFDNWLLVYVAQQGWGEQKLKNIQAANIENCAVLTAAGIQKYLGPSLGPIMHAAAGIDK